MTVSGRVRCWTATVSRKIDATPSKGRRLDLLRSTTLSTPTYQRTNLRPHKMGHSSRGTYVLFVSKTTVFAWNDFEGTKDPTCTSPT